MSSLFEQFLENLKLINKKEQLTALERRRLDFSIVALMVAVLAAYFAFQGVRYSFLIGELAKNGCLSYDVRTGNFLCSKTHLEKWRNQPNMRVEVCGRRVILKEEAAKAFLAANAEMEADYNKLKTGGWWQKVAHPIKSVKADWKLKCILVNASFRSNFDQRRMQQEYEVAAPPGMGGHEWGLDADVANFVEAKPYLTKHGFYGGSWTGICHDPWHFNYGRDIGPQKCGWFENHRWYLQTRGIY